MLHRTAVESDFDYLVLGGGSGGIASARRAARHGARVAVIESGRLGGTCVNVGCVPKKIMFNAASVAEVLRDSRDYGFALEPPSFDWARFKQSRDGYVARLNQIYARNLETDGVHLLSGRGKLLAPGVVQVGDHSLRAPHVLVATGGFPRAPDCPGAHLGITSDGFFGLEHQPKRVMVVGGGYIAVELCGILRALGSLVTLVFRGPRLLSHFDATLADVLGEHMLSDGVKLHPSTTLVSVTEQPAGELMPRTALGTMLGPFDCVLWAIGRRPATRGLGLEALGIAVDAEGHVVVDEYQRTSAEGVYALGDVCGKVALTPVAIAAGRRLADRLFGNQPGAKLDYENVPSVVFSHPPLATVGLTEQQAVTQFGREAIKVYSARFNNLYYAPSERKVPTLMKLVTMGLEERIVGMHVLGLGADEMIQGFAVAVHMGARKRDLDDTVAIHPTAAEEFVTMR